MEHLNPKSGEIAHNEMEGLNKRYGHMIRVATKRGPRMGSLLQIGEASKLGTTRGKGKQLRGVDFYRTRKGQLRVQSYINYAGQRVNITTHDDVSEDDTTIIKLHEGGMSVGEIMASPNP